MFGLSLLLYYLLSEIFVIPSMLEIYVYYYHKSLGH